MIDHHHVHVARARVPELCTEYLELLNLSVYSLVVIPSATDR